MLTVAVMSWDIGSGTHGLGFDFPLYALRWLEPEASGAIRWPEAGPPRTSEKHLRTTLNNRKQIVPDKRGLWPGGPV